MVSYLALAGAVCIAFVAGGVSMAVLILGTRDPVEERGK